MAGLRLEGRLVRSIRVSVGLGLGFGFGLEAAGHSQVVGEVSTTGVDEGQGEALGDQEAVVAVGRALVPAGVDPCLQRVLEPEGQRSTVMATGPSTATIGPNGM